LADLTTEHRDFMAQDQNLEVFDGGAAGEQSEPAEHRDAHQIQQAEQHSGRSCHDHMEPSNPPLTSLVRSFGTLQASVEPPTRGKGSRHGSPRPRCGCGDCKQPPRQASSSGISAGDQRSPGRAHRSPSRARGHVGPGCSQRRRDSRDDRFARRCQCNTGTSQANESQPPLPALQLQHQLRYDPQDQAVLVTAQPRVDSARVRGGT
jgi:hypothetical protein